MEKDDAGKGGATPLGSVTLAKSSAQGSVVPVPESEIGTEADLDIGDEGVPPIGPQDDLGLNLAGSIPYASVSEPPPPPIEFKSALPLYRISGSGDVSAPKPKAASVAKSPSGDQPKVPGPSLPPREPPGAVVSVRRETVWTSLADNKWVFVAVAAAVAAALIVALLVKSSDSARQKAVEAERLQKLSGEK